MDKIQKTLELYGLKGLSTYKNKQITSNIELVNTVTTNSFFIII